MFTILVATKYLR